MRTSTTDRSLSIGYTHNLAERFQAGDFESIHSMNDEELRAKLVAIKGIGDWSVDMYLLFSAHRPDIFPVGDLAVVKGLHSFLGIAAKMDKAAMLQVAERWRPYRSLAVWYLYRIVNSQKGLPKRNGPPARTVKR